MSNDSKITEFEKENMQAYREGKYRLLSNVIADLEENIPIKYKGFNIIIKITSNGLGYFYYISYGNFIARDGVFTKQKYALENAKNFINIILDQDDYKCL
ncbi:MAG: hypothetical protein ACFFG0_15605 [Candidatus Thorarchaeota archaeon]